MGAEKGPQTAGETRLREFPLLSGSGMQGKFPEMNLPPFPEAPTPDFTGLGRGPPGGGFWGVSGGVLSALPGGLLVANHPNPEAGSGGRVPSP